MHDSNDDGLNFFRGVLSMLGIYFALLVIYAIFSLIF